MSRVSPPPQPHPQVSSGALSYLGPQWRRDIAFAGNNVAMQVCGDGGGVWRPGQGTFPGATVCSSWCWRWAVLLLQGDIAAGQMIFGVEGVDPARRDRWGPGGGGVGAGCQGSLLDPNNEIGVVSCRNWAAHTPPLPPPAAAPPRLIQLLDVDLDWRLNRVSDGQRRRVQICLGLLQPYRVGG